jgi:hypothetical protein
MNTAIKQNWVTALRSGEYEQTKETFYADGAYCALGVLIDLHNKANPTQAVDLTTVESFPAVVSLWSETTFPTDEKPFCIIYVMEMNDAGRSFSECADFIEANL